MEASRAADEECRVLVCQIAERNVLQAAQSRNDALYVDLLLEFERDESRIVRQRAAAALAKVQSAPYVRQEVMILLKCRAFISRCSLAIGPELSARVNSRDWKEIVRQNEAHVRYAEEDTELAMVVSDGEGVAQILDCPC